MSRNALTIRTDDGDCLPPRLPINRDSVTENPNQLEMTKHDLREREREISSLGHRYTTCHKVWASTGRYDSERPVQG